MIYYDKYNKRNILKKQDGETFALEYDVPLERAGYWVKLGDEYAYFSAQNDKVQKIALGKKFLRFYGLD